LEKKVALKRGVQGAPTDVGAATTGLVEARDTPFPENGKEKE